ncbi:MAG: PD-(D/E)XK nuclease family protein [Atopobiaceae bacterium]
MGMHIVRTHAEGVLSADVVSALREANGKGPAVLIVPSFEAQIAAQKQLADQPDPALFGVSVTTLPAWIKERWEVWGTGDQLIEKMHRTIAMEQVLFGTGKDAAPAGMLPLLSKLAEHALPWLPLKPDMTADMLIAKELGLTDAETAAIGQVGRYAKLIHGRGYIEPAEAAADIVPAMEEAGARVPALVVSGVQKLSRSQRELLLAVARASDMWFVESMRNAAADSGRLMPAEELRVLAEDDGMAIDVRESETPCTSARAEELEELRGALFTEAAPVHAGGAVKLAEPAGPLAEAELLVHEIEAAAGKGMAQIVVAVPDTGRAWRELAPKLAAHGIAVTSRLERPLDECEAGRAFIEYAEAVAELAELASAWPEPDRLDSGKVRVHLGDMSWWPPRGLTDFLLSDISHMTTETAQRFDEKWRADRLLSPEDVLLTLQNERMVGASVARATQELLKGHIGTAAQRLLALYLEGIEAPDDSLQDSEGNVVMRVERMADPLSDQEAQGTLAGILNLAGTLKELGISADPKSEHPLPLKTVVAFMKQAMGEKALVLYPGWGGKDAAVQVRIAGASEVAGMEPASADAVFVCGQTSVESAVEAGDDVLSALLERCGIELAPDPMQDARRRFVSEISVPRHLLVMERTRCDADAEDSYPSVMMTELLASYGLDDGGKDDQNRTWDERAELAGMPTAQADESTVEKNLSAAGTAPRLAASEPILPSGAIGEVSKRYILVPPPGRIDLLDGRPLLSPSQIETYLECPLKWFSLRRLGLGDTDAGLGAAETGTFAHRVLEEVHAGLLKDALARMGDATLDLEHDPTVPVPGSRTEEDDGERLAFAEELLGKTFDEVLDEQFIHSGSKGRHQSFVPHNEEDEGKLRALRRDLGTLLSYEGGLFKHFEPRRFEWSFGHRDDPVEYAGCYLTGTIDRLDIDQHGNVCVIDYKHKSTNGFAKEYAIFPESKPAGGAPFVLPRRVQSLIYGQYVRRTHPELNVVAAVYLSTKDPHALSGAVAQNFADYVFGSHALKGKAAEEMIVPSHESFGTDEEGMDALLDATEELIRQKVKELMAGNIEAAPCDKTACSYCPVLGCERRLA